MFSERRDRSNLIYDPNAIVIMIKFIENSDKKLKFVSYPITNFFNYLVILFIFVPLLYWGLYLSPIYSSLTCQRTFLARIDCQLKEKSILNSDLREIDIKNVKKVGMHHPGSNDSRIIIKANPHPPYLHINRFQKTYFYPSNSFSLVLFRNFNPLNWFGSPNQNRQLDDFIRGKLNQPLLQLELIIKGGDYLFVGLFIGIVLLFVFSAIYWLLAIDVNSYEINLENKTLKILCQRLFGQSIKREYRLDKIKRIRLDTDYTDGFGSGRIILEFEPDYDYPIDEFFNAEEGQKNFQMIKDFLNKNK